MKNSNFSLINQLSIIAFLIYLNTASATPITSFGEPIYANQFTTIEWAVLYEAAGYRHDLYYQFGNQEGYIATNHWNTGGAHGCDFCSYPGDYGTFTLGQSTDNEIVFRLEINNGALQPLFSGSPQNNPDNLIHAWFSNAEGLSHIDENLLIQAEHESFDISTLFDHYENHAQINSLLSSDKTRFVGFEDILYGGDLDYNDIIFAFRGVTNSTAQLGATQIPTPSSLLLFLPAITLLLMKSKD